MLSYGIQSYRKTNVSTSDPVQLIIMCYEGAINNLKIAKEKLLQKDYEGKGNAIKKAVDIIAELQNAIDFEKGDKIAKNLDAVYSLISNKIIQGDLAKDSDALNEAANMLSDLLNAWETLSAERTPILPDNNKESGMHNHVAT